MILMRLTKSGKTTYEGTKIHRVTFQFGLQQLIHQVTHIIGET